MPVFFRASRQTCRRHALSCGLAVLGVLVAVLPAAQAQLPDGDRPLTAILLDRLCTNSLRPNEEDRLLGTISLTVRSTVRYQNGVLSPDLIDDAVQETLDALLAACAQIAATDDARRLGLLVEIAGNATGTLMLDKKRRYSAKETHTATAADLSQELSTREIDAWLDGLAPRERALALFLYASDVTPQQVASAVGLPAAAVGKASAATKTDLLKFFRGEMSEPQRPSAGKGSAMEFTVAGGEPVAALMQPEAADAAGAALRITGISSEVYAGWSLLATVNGLPRDRGLAIDQPLLLLPDGAGRKRMIVTGAAEISEPSESTRRFLLRAFAIDHDHEGSGLRGGFRLGPPIDNPQALITLHNTNLSTIEIARCLWHDYGGPDPGLCH